MGREATDLAVTPVRNPLYNESSWCRGKEKRHGRKEKGRKIKEAARRRTRDLTTRRGPFFFGGFPFSFLLERDTTKKGPRAPEKGGLRRGHVSQPGHLPLNRTHCYVPIISFTLAASHLSLSRPSSSSSPFPSSHPPSPLCLLALRLLVSRNRQLPFSLYVQSEPTHLPFEEDDC